MMRFTAYCGFLGSTAFLATGITPDIVPVSPLTFQGGAFACLCWALWYLLSHTLPALQGDIKDGHEAYIEAQKKDREDYRESLRKITDAFQKERSRE